MLLLTARAARQAAGQGDRQAAAHRGVFVERLWRSLKYEDIYLRAYATGSEARLGIGRWVARYNTTRPHQALGYRTPDEVYQSPPVAELAPTPIGVAA